MLDKLNAVESRYADLMAQLASPAVQSDPTEYRKQAKALAEIEPLVDRYREYKGVEAEIAQALELVRSSDAEMRALAQEELQALEARRETLLQDLKVLLVPKDPNDEKNVLLEIRAGTGGDEAALFAAELYRMYSRYAERQGWKLDVMTTSETGIGGIKEVIVSIEGRQVYSRLKYESGVHRVQRVPVTESSGRIHTSTATVAVRAEMEEVDLKIDDKDLEIDSYRSSGAGGQNVQKNETAIRITHKPSGLVVTCQDERSRTQNLLRAMSILRARLYDIEQTRIQEEHAAERRSMVGTGERAEKIRTYNYPQSRVTDHRINVSSYNLQAVIDGEIDQFIDELATRDQAEMLQGAGV